MQRRVLLKLLAASAGSMPPVLTAVTLHARQASGIELVRTLDNRPAR